MSKSEILFKDGDRYQGQINAEEKLDGKGVYYFKNGSKYSGSFKNNHFNGQGELWDSLNKITIKSTFIKNKAFGDAIITYSDGAEYTGNVHDNMREGKGEFKFGKGSEYKCYTGDFREDRFHGLGEIIYKDGSYYRGYFANGVFDGRGQLKLPQFLYKGDFKQGFMEGNGMIVYESKEEYEGEFRNNKRNGEGRYKYANGSVYVGGWKNDLRHGRGKLLLSDNIQYQGEFQDDEYSGNGVYHQKQIKISGEFQKSKLNGQVLISMPQNENLKCIFKDGVKNGFFELTKDQKGETLFYRGEFQNNIQNKIHSQISQRV